MTFETLEIIHGLLVKRLAKLEEKERCAKETENRLYERLERLESESDNPDSADIQVATMEVEAARDLTKKAMRECSKVRYALNEFESHEWC